ncbi:hypothetical protein [Aeromicrobium sp. 179-A 4D2 NHS]|uniref:hypothetical protein n=1 Tax=Aeromicrobium sp. 179-A 4D2 NHS TaxID=3142375 RepID=UPI0039A3BABF
MSDRPTGAYVIPLDPTGHPESRNDRYALGINPYTGETYLVHSEGVTYFVSHNKPFRFNSYDYLAKFWTLHDLVANFPLLTGQACDLADWVRVFGGRLESNQRLAYEALTTKKPRTHEDDPKFDPDVAKQIIGAALTARGDEDATVHLHVHTQGLTAAN